MYIQCANGPHVGRKYWVPDENMLKRKLVIRWYGHPLYHFAHYHITGRKSSEGNLIAVHIHSST